MKKIKFFASLLLLAIFMTACGSSIEQSSAEVTSHEQVDSNVLENEEVLVEELPDEQLSEAIKEKISINISQVDTKEYPLVNLYVYLEDLDGNKVEIDNELMLTVTEENAQSSSVSLKSVSEDLKRNVCFVLDTSGSMSEDNRYINANQAISSLLDIIESQDEFYASLISFSNTQNLLEDFTTSFTNFRSELNATSPTGQTAFWDTLELALLRTASQDGQKCIIAATDGEDNVSISTREEIETLSLQLQIPIYIISFDYALSTDLYDFAINTGGDCMNVQDNSDLSAIYEEIFNRQQSQYVTEFISDGNTQNATARNITLEIISDDYEGELNSSYIKTDEIYLSDVSNANIASITASSHLVEYYESTGTLNHEAMNVIDGSYRTAWVENSPDYGIGEWLEIKFDSAHNMNGIEISNGYKKSSTLYEKNSRPRILKFTFSDGTSFNQTMEDRFEGSQTITFPSAVVTNSVKIEIMDIYQGSVYQDTCITEIRVF